MSTSLPSYQQEGRNTGGTYAPIPGENGEGTKSNFFCRKSSLLVLGSVAVLAAGFSYVYDGGKGIPSQNAEEVNNAAELTGKLFDSLDRYVLEDYDAKPTFSNFLPGVAGLYGKPMWTFYVNRGQGFSSFGVDSKDYPILEFNAANKAYISTAQRGFRTFIKATRDGETETIEPFSPATARSLQENLDDESLPKRFMFVGTNEMEILETDERTGLETNVIYFLMPKEDFAAVVRRTNITNTGDTPVTIDVLDGLPKIEPAGGGLDFMLKNMGRTLEGWMGVYHADEKKKTMPFYRLSTQPSDSASVKIQEAGHYVLAYTDDKPNDLLPIVYDSSKVFGRDTTLNNPWGFENVKSVDDIVNGKQYGAATTSSAFVAISKKTLAPGESVTINSFYGKASKISEVSTIARVVRGEGWVDKKLQEARSTMDDITAAVTTTTGNHLFNGAIKQMYMDNGLRGGLPVILGDVNDELKLLNSDEDERVKVFHVFSRIHGDLERDYNSFHLKPAYFSQGPGNYRDVAQNRRNDVILSPRVAGFDIKMFLSYVQADGYEPLTVEAIAFYLKDKEKCKYIAETATGNTTNVMSSTNQLHNILCGGTFRPGQLFELIEQLGVNVIMGNDKFINLVLSEAQYTVMGVYGTGFWADHWEYYLDMIEAYLSIYPDGEEQLMYDNELRYFYSTAHVKPRSEKYILTYTFDGKSKHVQQLDATAWDEEKIEQKTKFFDTATGLFDPLQADWQHQLSDSGVLTSSPIAKLFLLVTTKYTMRDAYGMGVEYEGGRPGWNDAMNGLVGMVGSGMPETYELLVLLKYVKKVVSTYDRPLVIPAELLNLVQTANAALAELLASGYTDNFGSLSSAVPQPLFTYWDTCATAREEYRASVRLAFSGDTEELSADFIVETLSAWINQVDQGIKRAFELGTGGDGNDGTSGVTPCYFSFDVTEWKLNGGHSAMGLPTVDATSMAVGIFPLFLEGPVRYMKTIADDTETQLEVYNKVMNTGLRDEPLKMYTLSDSLIGQSYDMGRMMAFSPGWLENQSIWLHMSYKYYLQLIRGGLYEEFFSEMVNGGMLPFMEPVTYGRSLMECSSFLASSAFVDPSMHGRGFLPRLSGSTAEFLSMYILMMMGPKLFFLDDDGGLNFQLKPALPLWLFESDTGDASDESSSSDDSSELTITYKLFSAIDVTVHNTAKKNIFGIAPNSYNLVLANGTEVSIEGGSIGSEYADSIRRILPVKAIHAYF